MNAPTVSVVIATYNYGQYLPQALDSVRDQTLSDWETIVVDDGSTDYTPQVIRPYLQEARFRYHRTENRGPSAARNTGVSLSRSPLIAFLDADDQWMPTKLARQVALFQNNPELGLVCARKQLLEADGMLYEARGASFFRGHVLPQLFQNNFVGLSTCMTRRAVLDHVGLFDEGYRRAEDYDLWLRIAAHYPIDFIDEALSVQRMGHASLSSSSEAMASCALQIMWRFLNNYRDDSLSPSVIRRAFADAYCSLAWAQRGNRPLAALASYIRALRYGLLRYNTWRAIAALAIPGPARDLIRPALGRPAESDPLIVAPQNENCKTTS
jgi:glycosyltransferase involved in cell wall biosynthesis